MMSRAAPMPSWLAGARAGNKSSYVICTGSRHWWPSQRLEHGVREAHRHDVPERFPCPVMVIRKTSARRKMRNDIRRVHAQLKIVEWLLDDDASPLAALALLRPVSDRCGDDGENGRRDRQVRKTWLPPVPRTLTEFGGVDRNGR